MIRLKRTLGACMLFSVLVPTIVAQAATYYVATTGSNSNPGTEQQPWKTVAHAVNIMVAGDTTYVRAGTYSGETAVFSRSGTQALPIKLLNYPGETPIFDCGSVGTNQIYIRLGGTSGPVGPIGWITIEGFEIRHCYNGLRFVNTHDSVFRRNWMHDNAHQGVVGNGTRNLIDRNVINGNGDQDRCNSDPAWCTQEHGIYANGTAITVTNNIIYNNIGNGIQYNGSATYNASTHAGTEYAISHNWIIANNTFAYQRYGSAIVVWGANCDNTRIENNIMYENGVNGNTGDTQGVHFLSAANSLGVTVRNNHLYASGSGRQRAFTPTGQPADIVISENVINVSPPAFVNAPATLPASPNFSLTDRSPAIDRGLSLAAITMAFDGTSRPQGRAWDIGAYEYKTGRDNQSPTAPVALRAE